MDAQYTGTQIFQLRKSLGLTQRELAEKLHVTDKAVSKWERGINFPDLGLMETLAEVLGTTPAYLLGLEEANQTETLCALAEISAEQLEEARRDLRLFSWGSIAAAILLALAYHLTQKRAVEVYYLLHSMITVIGIVGLVYLFKYEQIKKWGIPELCSFYGCLIPLLIYYGYQFITGHYPLSVPVALLLALAAASIQIHFLQVMKPKVMQLLPLILSTLFVLWQVFLGGVNAIELIPMVCCQAILAIHWRKHPRHWRIHWKALGIGLCLILLVVFFICMICYPSLTRTYVTANQEHLEVYAQELLETRSHDTYGLWEVTAYPELGVVQFTTGGSGLAPGSIYEGFYYSASGTHIPFPGFAADGEITPREAWFRDPAENSDNWQKSTQIAPNWYWFELHY